MAAIVNPAVIGGRIDVEFTAPVVRLDWKSLFESKILEVMDNDLDVVAG